MSEPHDTKMFTSAEARVPDDLSRRQSGAVCGLTQGVKARRRAFTLIELLVVIAIIAILAAILLPLLRMTQVRAQDGFSAKVPRHGVVLIRVW